MPKFTLDKIVYAKRNIVFDVFSNFENYQKLFPQHFPSVRVRSMRGDTSVVEEHLMLGPIELVIMAKHVIYEPSIHEFFIIGGDAKGSHIHQQFLEHSEGTKILVDVDLKLKGKMKLSGLFSKNRFEKDYEIILDDFVKTAEKI